jgi:hypothetical protein
MAKVVLREPDIRAIEFARTELSTLLIDVQRYADDKKKAKAVGETIQRLQGLTDRYNAASLPKAKAALDYRTLFEAARSVLGNRAVAPPSGAWVIISQIVKRVELLGLSLDDWRSVCKAAGMRWKGVIRIESVARQADKLLSGAEDDKAEVPPAEDWSRIGE